MVAALTVVVSIVLIIPVVLSALAMAAHLTRAWGLTVGLLALTPLVLLAIRRPWVPRVLQVLLLVGAAEWVRTVAALAEIRLATGMPWMRMVMILGGVTLVTALSAWVFEAAPLRRFYRRTV